MKSKILKITAVILVFIMLFTFTACGISETSKRQWKTAFSDYTGGLNRTVYVYDYNGNSLRTYKGKFSVSESDNETYFDYNGKRVIIQNAIIINEED